MTTEEKSRYFKELTLNLQHEGFTVGPEEDGRLPVELEGRPLCRSTEEGGVRYLKGDVAGDGRGEALEKVIAITKATAEYMEQMEAAPQLTASGLTGDYRLLADFNDTVLAGHPTKYGVQFVTWDRVRNRTGLNQGYYYGPSAGVDSYAAAKRDFATRSGLVPSSALFTPEQLTEMYRSIDETLANIRPLTDERIQLLESASKQIKNIVPDMQERTMLSMHKEEELEDMMPQQDDGMQFC